MNTKDIGKIIRQRREELHLSQLSVAKFVGVSESTVSRWESGNIANMKRNNIARLAKILQLSPIIFIDVNETKEIHLTVSETSLLSDYRKLNADGQGKVNEYTRDLTGNPQYSLPQITVTHTEEPHDIFSDPDMVMAASGLTSTSELSDHNKAVILEEYNKSKKTKKG